MINRAKFFANSVLVVIAVLFLMMSYYAFYRSDSYPPGHMSMYYVISASGFSLFLLILFKCSVELKVKVSLLFLSIIISSYMIEIIFAYKNDSHKVRNPRLKMAKYLGMPFDPRSKYQVMMDFRARGVDAYAFHNSTQYLDYEGKGTMPLGFISDKEVIYCNETGEYLTYTTDEHGFNNASGLYDQEPFDFILIGDSFTNGNCVRREQNIAGLLGEKERTVLNLGMGNTGPLYQLAILKEYASSVKPRHVLWFFYEGNDHEGLTHEKKSSILPKYLDSKFTQGLKNKQKIVDRLIIESIEQYVSGFKSKDEQNENYNGDTENNDNLSLTRISSILELSDLRGRLAIAGRCTCSVDPLLREIFEEAKSSVNQWGGKLTFVYLPAWERYQTKANFCRKRFLNSGKKQVLSIIRDLKIPIIDVEEAFGSHADPLSLFPMRIKGHYNAEGYKLVVKHIEAYVSNDR